MRLRSVSIVLADTPMRAAAWRCVQRGERRAGRADAEVGAPISSHICWRDA
jgi:hypothetical protein